jgi:hypothetical protein
VLQSSSTSCEVILMVRIYHNCDSAAMMPELPWAGLDLGKLGEAALEILVRWLVVAHGAVVERFIGLHVEVAGAGEAEEDRLFASFRLAAQRFVDGGADGVARFRRGQDAFGAGELLGGGVTSAP